ncbi:hypothetical protein LguiA_036657 [Lonicera macranthoides]
MDSNSKKRLPPLTLPEYENNKSATEKLKLNVELIAPPVSGAFKEAISDFTYGNFSVPKGWKAFWSVHTTHKDPKYFPNPEKFDPLRFEGNGPIPFTFVPFGGGPRMCPGSEFARLEVLVFMHRLVTTFRWEKVIPNEKIVYDPFPMLVSGLPIRLLPHQN